MKKIVNFITEKIFWRIALLLWAVTILFPLLWIINVSLKTNREFYQSIWALPEIPQFSNYINSWKIMDLGRAFWNTFVYVGLSLVIQLTFSVTTAYSLSRVQFRARKLLTGLVMLSLFLPGINAMVPTYITLKNLHLLNFPGLIIFSSCGISAFNVMVLSGFLSTIPYEMEESAFMDGAGYFKTLIHIILPLTKPGIVTILVFAFLGFYNSYVWPDLILGGDKEKYVIATKMAEINLKMKYNSNWVGLCACIVIGMVPSVFFYVLMRKHVTGGLTLGSLKG